MKQNSENPVTRCEALRMIGGGFGMMAFAGTVTPSLAQAQTAKLDYPERVKRVIFLFMNGGMSHVNTVDPTSTMASRFPAERSKPNGRLANL